MSRTRVVTSLVLLIFATLAQVRAERPNVVVFYTDDQGTLDANCYGSKDLYTPHIESLASTGVRFTQFYAHTVCCPSRAMLMTGRHPQRSGVNRWSQGDVRQTLGINMDLREVTLAESLKTAGYRTALFGKWHLGGALTHGPTEQGFDEFYGIRGGFIDNFNHYYLHGEGYHDLYRGTEEQFEDGKYFPDLVVNEATRFLDERSRDEKQVPFLLLVAFNIPHYPEQADRKFAERYKDLPMPRRSYAEIVSTTDDRIGRVLTKMDEVGLRENTIVVFLSDNGHSAENHSIRVSGHNSGLPRGHHYGANSGGGNTGPWRGNKGTFFEGGVRVPMIVNFPVQLPQGAVRDQVTTIADIYPTLLELCSVPLPKVKLDGASLLPILRSAKAATHHEALHWQWFDFWAVREGDWKLIDTRRDGIFLGNLKDAEPERRNHAANKPEIVARLKALHEEWVAEVTPNPDLFELVRWISDARGPVRRLMPWPEVKPSVGSAYRDTDVVYFKMPSWPENGEVTFPRLNNPNKRLYLLGDPERIPLKLSQSPSTWKVTLPQKKPDSAHPVVVFEVDGLPYLPVEPRVLSQGSGGGIHLPAHEAVTYGEKLFYEPQPYKNTLGYWVNVDDWAQWHVNVAKPGIFDVYILQGCGTRHGGSDVAMEFAGSTLLFQTEETGHFQKFKRRRIGQLQVHQPGRYQLNVKPQKIAYKAVMDLRLVELVPAG